MAKYLYQGPQSGLSLPGPDGTVTEHMLVPGAEIELPDDNVAVKALIARGHLNPVPAPSPSLATRRSKEG